MHLAELPKIDVRNVDINSPEFRTLRAEPWMVRSELGYVVLRYADCSTMLRDGRLQQATTSRPRDAWPHERSAR